MAADNLFIQGKKMRLGRRGVGGGPPSVTKTVEAVSNLSPKLQGRLIPLKAPENTGYQLQLWAEGVVFLTGNSYINSSSSQVEGQPPPPRSGAPCTNLFQMTAAT